MIIVGNILGFIASIIGIGYFKSNDKNKICIYSIIMCLFQIASMFVLGAYSGLVIVTCNIFRALLTRFDKWDKYWIFIFTCTIIGFTFHFYKSPLDFLSVIGVIINNIGFLLMQKGKLKTFRWLRFCANLMWTSYYGYIMNFASMGFEIIYTIINLREIFKMGNIERKAQMIKKYSNEDIILILQKVKKNEAIVLDFDGVLFAYPYLSVGKECPEYNEWVLDDIHSNGYLGNRSYPNEKLCQCLSDISARGNNNIFILSTIQTYAEIQNKLEAIRQYCPYIDEKNCFFVSNDDLKSLYLFELSKSFSNIFFFDDNENNIKNKSIININSFLVDRFI